MQKKAYLILENGKIFKAKRFGKHINTYGELVFNTSMTGYNETLTDPSYFGQFVVQTFPLIGNYGIIPEDFESSKIHMKAYIVNEFCNAPSNFRCWENIDSFLKQQNVAGLFDIDTRTLTKVIRNYGVMNAKITDDISNLDEQLKQIKSYKNNNTVKYVSNSCEKHFCDNRQFKVVLFDFGTKENIIRELIKHDCDVILLPYNTNYKKVKEINPDGIMLSNGPGDPIDNIKIINELKKIQTLNIPTFGICLGHQLMAIANGAKTVKLKYGHRGANQPVVNLNDNKIYITSQNHGYAVLNDSIPKNAKLIFKNVNDSTCEGIEYLSHPSFSVQFHPEAASGPNDTLFLFDKFKELMKEKIKCL